MNIDVIVAREGMKALVEGKRLVYCGKEYVWLDDAGRIATSLKRPMDNLLSTASVKKGLWQIENDD